MPNMKFVQSISRIFGSGGSATPPPGGDWRSQQGYAQTGKHVPIAPNGPAPEPPRPAPEPARPTTRAGIVLPTPDAPMPLMSAEGKLDDAQIRLNNKSLSRKLSMPEGHASGNGDQLQTSKTRIEIKAQAKVRRFSDKIALQLQRQKDLENALLSEVPTKAGSGPSEAPQRNGPGAVEPGSYNHASAAAQYANGPLRGPVSDPHMQRSAYEQNGYGDPRRASDPGHAQAGHDGRSQEEILAEHFAGLHHGPPANNNAQTVRPPFVFGPSRRESFKGNSNRGSPGSAHSAPAGGPPPPQHMMPHPHPLQHGPVPYPPAGYAPHPQQQHHPQHHPPQPSGWYHPHGPPPPHHQHPGAYGGGQGHGHPMAPPQQGGAPGYLPHHARYGDSGVVIGTPLAGADPRYEQQQHHHPHHYGAEYGPGDARHDGMETARTGGSSPGSSNSTTAGMAPGYGSYVATPNMSGTDTDMSSGYDTAATSSGVSRVSSGFSIASILRDDCASTGSPHHGEPGDNTGAPIWRERGGSLRVPHHRPSAVDTFRDRRSSLKARRPRYHVTLERFSDSPSHPGSPYVKPSPAHGSAMG